MTSGRRDRADSLAVSKLIAFRLSFDLGDIDRTVAAQSYGRARAERRSGALLPGPVGSAPRVLVQGRRARQGDGNFHVLRHTFCSHLAMQGAPAKAIQKLAGHAHLSTTLRYMHLAKGHKELAIKLLDARREPANEHFRGGGVEAET